MTDTVLAKRRIKLRGLENDGPLFASHTSRKKDVRWYTVSVGPAITVSSWYRRRTAGYPHHHYYQRMTQRHLRQLVAYVKRTWLDRRSVGPNRVCVRDDRARKNNVLESYHFGLRRRIQVSHPNLFLTHLYRLSPSTKRQTLRRLKRGIRIRRPKKKRMTPASRHASRAVMPEHTLNFSFCAP